MALLSPLAHRTSTATAAKTSEPADPWALLMKSWAIPLDEYKDNKGEGTSTQSAEPPQPVDTSASDALLHNLKMINARSDSNSTEELQQLLDQAILLSRHVERVWDSLCTLGKPTFENYIAVIDYSRRASINKLGFAAVERFRASGQTANMVIFTALLELVKSCGFGVQSLERMLPGILAENGREVFVDAFFKTLEMYAKFLGLQNAVTLFQSISSYGVVCNSSFYNRLLIACSSDLKITMRIFEMMKQEGVSPDLQTYNTALKSFADFGDAAGATMLFNKLKADGLMPNVQTFEHLLKSRMKDLDQAMAVLDMIQEVAAQPTPRMFQQLLSIASYAGDTQAMRVLHKRFAGHYNLTPNRNGWAHIINCLKQTNDLGTLKFFVQECRRLRIYPNQHFFQGALDMAAVHRDVDLGLELISQLEHHNRAVGSTQALAVTRVLCESKQTSKMPSTLERIFKLGAPPSYALFRMAMLGCADVGDWRSGDKIFTMAQLNQIEPDVNLWNIKLKAHTNGHNMSGVEDTYKMMLTSKVVPDAVTFNTLILAAERIADPMLAAEMFNRMVEAGVRPDEYSFNTLLCAVRGDLVKTRHVLTQMEQFGVSPSIDSYNWVFFALTRENQMEAAFDLAAQIKQKGIKFNTRTFGFLITVSCNCGQPEAALNCHREMREAGLLGDSHIYFPLLQLLSNAGDTRTARTLLEMAEEDGVNLSEEAHDIVLQACARINDETTKQWVMSRIGMDAVHAV